MDEVQDVSYYEARRIPYALSDSPNGYWRAWCVLCLEPVRVSQKNTERAVCDSCVNNHVGYDAEACLTPRQVIGKAKIAGLKPGG